MAITKNGLKAKVRQKMKKYKFRLSDSNFITFSQEELDGFKDVTYVKDYTMGKIIPIKREFDGNLYHIIAPLELIEECEDE